MSDAAQAELDRARATRSRRLRALALALVLGGVYAAMHQSGLLEEVTIDWVRAQVADAGAWGWLAFVGVFVGGVLLYIPGFVFVISGVLIFGPLVGGLLSWVAGLLASSAAFTSTRLIGGDAVTGIEQPTVKRLLDHIEEHPVRTTALLRTFLYLSPPANIALALSPVTFRQHLLGTLLGFTPVTVGYALFTDLIIEWMGLAGP